MLSFLSAENQTDIRHNKQCGVKSPGRMSKWRRKIQAASVETVAAGKTMTGAGVGTYFQGLTRTL
jgi:hypothetical protein